ncbi:AraC family transcriptional regulator [uncultured Eubacterium sp.]|uniref:helix-turn-helix transcriptional regulator n=1 Tax=uncultured Eubacterium sp. TaxID=165185 RepID=UPI002597F7C3|nr:AraC family transcriptional regulator [uncultured Eubacterium sp.]
MAKIYHETLHSMGNLGIQVSLSALEIPHIPAHWHNEMEILFCLNGEINIHIEQEQFTLSHNQLIVFDSKEVHSIHTNSKLYMFLCIHIDKKQLSVYCPDLELSHIKCRPIPLDNPKIDQYIHLCHLAHDLTRANIEIESTSAMRSDGTALLMLADLIRYFSDSSMPESSANFHQANDTLCDIISYVNEHYTEKITLQNVATHVGFTREYFCRFFKEHMGLTFFRYLSEVRISHASRLLSNSNLSVSEIMCKSGFTNQTLFNRLFKEIYGITPRQARHSTTQKPNLQELVEQSHS